jgi:outer membrane protein assembly factor BamD (BamD/ComL family)
MFSNAKDALRRLLSKYPESGFRADAQSLLEEINTSKKD